MTIRPGAGDAGSGHLTGSERMPATDGLAVLPRLQVHPGSMRVDHVFLVRRPVAGTRSSSP